MKYLCGVLLFCFFVTALSNSTKVSSKTDRTDNDTKHHLHCGVNNNYFYAGPNSKKIENMFSDIQQQLTKLQQEIRNTKKDQTCVKQDGKAVYKNCAEVYKSGDKISGVYKINPDGLGEFEVFCDQTTAGGGWTVFQKRYNGAVDFFRVWYYYKQGFGNLTGEFWLGLDKIRRLTANSRNKLRVDLEDLHGETAFAEYSLFSVGSKRVKYLLGLGVYSGTAGDSLSYHRGLPFSTKDRDNDPNKINCAFSNKGAWWYNGCNYSNLNGPYMNSKYSGGRMRWYHWKKDRNTIKRSEMKIRPKDF